MSELEMRGLGRRNLHYMRSFAEAWPDVEVVQRLIAQLPWGHNVELLSGLDASSDRVWYAKQAIAHGWSRNVLAAQIMSRLHLRSGAAPSNFSTALPPSESELVQQLIKDPYHLDFLDLSTEATERMLENELIEQSSDSSSNSAKASRSSDASTHCVSATTTSSSTCSSSTSRRSDTWWSS